MTVTDRTAFLILVSNYLFKKASLLSERPWQLLSSC
jgi:hypothetical protein